MIRTKKSGDLEILDTHPQIWYQYQFENPFYFSKKKHTTTRPRVSDFGMYPPWYVIPLQVTLKYVTPPLYAILSMLSPKYVTPIMSSLQYVTPSVCHPLGM